MTVFLLKAFALGFARRFFPSRDRASCKAGPFDDIDNSRINDYWTRMPSLQRRISTALILAIGLALDSPLEPLKAADSKKAKKEAREEGAVRLPALLDDEMFYVQLRIAGQGPFNLLVDTGTTVTMISPQVATRLDDLGLLGAPRERTAKFADGKSSNVQLFEIGKVQAGKFIFSEAHVIVRDTTIFSKLSGKTIDGIAGMELFQDGALILDYPKQELWFETRELVSKDTNSSLSSNPSSLLPRINVAVGGITHQLLVDSGSNEGFNLPMDSKLKLVEPPRTIQTSAGMGGLVQTKAARLDSNVTLSGLEFEKPIIKFGEDRLLGSKVLKHFAVAIDLRQKRVFLKPGTSDPVKAGSVRSLGMSLLGDEQGLKVMAVIPNTDAERSGIQPGEHVKAINGEPASVWSQKRLRELRDTAENFEVEFASPERPKPLKFRVETLVK